MRRTVWPCLAAAAWLVASAAPARTETWTLTNPTDERYVDEPVRLGVDVPPDAVGNLIVKADGREVGCQVETIRGKAVIWAPATLAPGQSATYSVERGRPAKARPKVTVRRDGDCWLLDSGRMAVRLPAVARDGPPGPIAAVRLPDGKWVGRSFWHSGRKCTDFSATVVGDGTVFAKVRLQYAFEGLAGLWGKTPAHAVLDVSLAPGGQHVTVEESHEMDRESWWEFDCTAGWGAREAISEIFGGAAGRPANREMWPKDFKPLGWSREAVDRRYADADPRLGDTLMWLVARWNQHYEDGWLFAAADATSAVGAMPVRAAHWFWPHDNKIAVKAKPSGDYAGLRCPTWRGRRMWLLYAGPRDRIGTVRREVPPRRQGDRPRVTYEVPAVDYVFRYAWRSLDKVAHEYITDWPGNPDAAGGQPAWPRSINPVRMRRGYAGGSHGGYGASTPLQRLVGAQVVLDPDFYGSYWNFWSPENPNFYSSLMSRPMAAIAGFSDHPRFGELAYRVRMRFHEDVYHSATLPGGAGQECPGYFSVGGLRGMARSLRALGFDGTRWPRLKAGAEFLFHISQPRPGGTRVYHPGGDTHPGPNGPKSAEAWRTGDPRTWKTEERPGFGVVFRNRPGTDGETYLAFKSGPNRGHFHGDQLSFHWCAHARPVAVDHYCSYRPRAGQEHMHNRVAFSTDDLPFTNMDGYERLIAFRPGDVADIAVGQVQSDRLRYVTKLPPEDWDRDYPQHVFKTPLKYRRTVVMLKGGAGKDYFVIRDQYAGPDPLRATWCLHAYGDRCDRDGPRVDFDGLRVFVAAPAAFDYGRFDWSHTNGGGEATKGIRLGIRGKTGEFITVLCPGPPAGTGGGSPAAFPKIEAVPAATGLEGDGVRVGDDEVRFTGGIDERGETVYVTVRRGGRIVASLTGKDICLDRSQGEIGLFVPNTGYPFGRIPDWLIRQRVDVPDWAKEWVGRYWPDRLDLARPAAK